MVLDKETGLSLTAITVTKLKDAAQKGELNVSGNPMDLGRLWAEMGDKAEAIAWVRLICDADDRFLVAVRGAVSESHSWSMGDRVARTSLRMAVEYMCSFFEPLVLRDRAKALLENQTRAKSLDKRTRFGLEQLRDRIRDDGSVVEEKKFFDEEE